MNAVVSPVTDDLLRQYDVSGPRYTSYPTADRFVEAFVATDYAQALTQRRSGASALALPLSLYVHIPFCESLCYYCACNKIITKHHEKAAEYLRYLTREVELHTQLIGTGQSVSQLHLGGGSPTFLTDDELRSLMAMLKRNFSFAPGGEYSIEIDPRTIDEKRLGARLGGNAVKQTRVVAWREGFALAGVICASVLPTVIGWAATTLGLGLGLALGLALLARAPRAGDASGGPAHVTPFGADSNSNAAALVWRTPGFRRLLAVFLLNGIAAAVPATLLLFFVRDRLQTPQAEGLYLAAYFIAAALSLPLWLRVVARVGQARAWGLSMLLAVSAFAWAAGLGVGDSTGFALVCLASGVALGADLAIPGAMLTRVIQQAGLSGRAEGAFFGWWNAANKLNLALAAGLGLPLLQWLGYAPGRRDDAALQALTLAYCLLPCLLKLAAAGLLYLFWIRHSALDPAFKETS